jgi:hypothetical protein
MARRNKATFIGDLFDLLLAVPWWGGPLLAGLTYLFLRYLVLAVLGLVRAADSQSAMIAPLFQLFT